MQGSTAGRFHADYEKGAVNISKFSASPVRYSTFQLLKVTANLQAIKTHLADLTGTGDALMASSGPRVSLRKSYYSH